MADILKNLALVETMFFFLSPPSCSDILEHLGKSILGRSSWEEHPRKGISGGETLIKADGCS